MKGRIVRQEPSQRLGLPIVGKIKIGKKSEKGYPMSVDYFIASGKYAPLFHNVYGDKPDTIQVLFTSDDASKVCIEKYEFRDNEGKLVAQGDGYEFSVWNGKKYITMNTDEYPNLMESIEKRYSKGKQLEWKITLTLNFILPLVRGIAGIWQFNTRGNASTIPQIRETFDYVLENRGFVKMVVFDLHVEFAKSQKPGDKSRYPVVSLIANESEENVNKIRQALQPVKLLNSKKNEKVN